MRLKFILPTLLAAASVAFGHASYTGYSGAPGRQTCAASCHGSGGGTVTVTGFPAQYTPNQSYLITIQRASGSSIANFNGSCRIGTGTQNAGTLSAGTLTATYNVSGETNGVHLSSNNQNSATFNWLAPPSGTGTVRLYVGAHQGSASGPNTTIVQVSDEAAGTPQPATNPVPSDGATGVSPSVVLAWTAGSGAESHDVYFGSTNPPPMVGNQTETQFDPPDSLQAGTTYYWRIDERNTEGVTEGTVWQFTILSLPGQATNPSPEDMAQDILPTATLSWTAGAATELNDIYFGTDAGNLPLQESVNTPAWDPPGDLTAGTVYYWRIDERNEIGVTAGTLWQFTTMSLPGQATDPVPQDLAENVPVATVLSWTAGASAETHDVYFGISADNLELQTTQSATEWDPPGDLNSSTTYYWRIDEHNAAGVTDGMIWSFTTETGSQSSELPAIPTETHLGTAYPNPFNATVTIPFTLSNSAHVSLTMYDVQGRQIAVLLNSQLQAGEHAASWGGEDLPSGVYLVRLTAGELSYLAKIVALK